MRLLAVSPAPRALFSTCFHSRCRLPVHSVAGATLTATLLTSIFALAGCALLPAPVGIATAPDWLLGVLFGLGGFVGGNLGARCQGHVPQKFLKVFLAAILLGLAARYLWT